MFLLFSSISTLTTFLLQLMVAECLQAETDFCDSGCTGVPASDLSSQIGVRYTYHYTTSITSSLHGTSSGRNGLALDCVVDIDVVSKCHLMMQIRNPQIKRLSSQKEHSVQSLKSLRESLERARLKFSLRGGRVTALCLQEGEQVWVRNIKRAFLSMLQTSSRATRYSLQNETDVYGTCRSRYERQGPVLLKTRDLNQCHQSRLAKLWPHSVPVSDDTELQAELHCVQRPGPVLMERVNCTETVLLAMLSTNTGRVKTQTVSTLLLLRAQPGISGDSGHGVLTDLQFEEEGSSPTRGNRASIPEQAVHTVEKLCTLSEQQQISQEFLHLVFLLRDLTFSQLKGLWQEASFKCRNDRQLLLDALSACGSENCVLLLIGLMRSGELEEAHTLSFLNTLSLIPHPSTQMIASVNTLLEIPEFRPKVFLVGSSLIHQLCQTSHCPCTELPAVKFFLQELEDVLHNGCEKAEYSQVQELLFALKSVGNTGVSAPAFIPLLSRCALSDSVEQELRLAAIQAFRRIPCSENRSVLLQLYSSSQEDPEVRIAAYQQLLHCPHQDLFTVVRETLRNETSSQVGSYVWTHLTNVLRSEDPLKQRLIESLPDDIISRDFEGEFLKYSSYSDHTVVSDLGITNLETSLVFSPKSFLPRSASAKLTVYFNGRASNLIEVHLRGENAELLFKNIFGHEKSWSATHSPKHTRTRKKEEDGETDKENCLSGTESYLSRASALLFRRRKSEDTQPKCWFNVKVFGNEVFVLSCEDIYKEINLLSLNMAELVIKLLKGQEVQLNHRAVLLTEELVLPSLSGLPLKLAINMTSLLSLRLKGSAHYTDISHFSLNGYIKPNAYIGLMTRMGVDSAMGQAAVEWDSALSSSLSLDGSVQLQEGRDLRVMLNTPEDTLDIISFRSQVFQLSGDHREEIKGPKSRSHKTICTPKTLSKMVGWQLCYNVSHPFSTTGLSLPPSGPVHLSLRLLKLDRGLHYYLLEAVYSLLTQRGTWIPREASLHLLLSTPQSTVPRDMSLDLVFSPHRLLLRLSHPLKTIIIQGQLEQERNIKSVKVEILIDGAHFYILGLVDKQIIATEQRTRYHFEVKMSATGAPMILSANVTRGLGRKTSFSASLKNIFRETASISVALERRRDSISKQYSVEGELLLPGVVGGRMLGLVEQRASLWSSALRLKYGLGGEARHLHQECFTSQRLKSERDSNRTYVMRADHEFYCSNAAAINHKVQIRHEESLSHVKSSLDLSYGKHWDEINNKHKLTLGQMFRNQSRQNHTSYTLEFSLQAPEKNLNYRTQLLHSHLKHHGSESSTHLKIHYNDLMPLVAGLHWKGPPRNALQKKWEGTFNMDTPWLYIYTVHKLSRQQAHTLQLTSELNCSKWLTIRNLVLEGLYRDRGRETEAWLHLHSPAVTYLQTGGWVLVGKKSLKASCSLKSLWTPPLGGDVSLESSKFSHTLQITSSYGTYNATLTAALNSVEKKLKKRQALLKMTWCELPGRPTELVVEGAVEELKRTKKMFQKMAKLRLRQPFQSFPHSLVVQETFTADMSKGLYVLESRAAFSGNKEVLHKLTLGYKPPSPFLSSTLIHPFSSSILPSESEIHVALFTNQTHKDIQGRLHIGNKEKLVFIGQVHFNPLRSGIQVKANFSHHLQLQLPSSALMEGNVCWLPKNNIDFDYQAKGRLRIERQECRLSFQLNGTSSKIRLFSSLSHPFKSMIPKMLEAKATADIFPSFGGGRSSIHLRTDEKDKMIMDAQVFHRLQRAEKEIRLKINISQSLLPTTTKLFVDMSANMSSESVSIRGSYKHGDQTLRTQVKGSLQSAPGVQLAVSGDLQHNIKNVVFLPLALKMDGTLGKTDNLIEGELKVKGTDSLYRVELRHRSADGEEGELNNKGDQKDNSVWVVRDWLCVWFGVENLCVNISHRLGGQHGGEVKSHLSHSFRQLNATGVPFRSSAKVGWAQVNGQISALAEMQFGAEHLLARFNGSRGSNSATQWAFNARLEHQVKALVKSGISNLIQAEAHYKLESDGVHSGMTFTVEDNQVLDVILNAASRNNTATLMVSLWQQIQLLQRVLPTGLQMNCKGNTTAERLSAQCYGKVAGHPTEDVLCPQTSFNLSVSRSGCATSANIVLKARNTEKGSISVSLRCKPSFRFRASVQQSVEGLQMLGFPAHGEVFLNHSPDMDIGLELGSCFFKGHLKKSFKAEEYTVNATSYCPLLQEMSLPVSLFVHGLLSVVPCQRTLSSAVRADNQDLSLELHQSCSPPHVSASLSHSLTALRSRGLPQDLTVEATAPWGPKHSGALFIKAGTCHLRANRVKRDNSWSQWIWALELDCPLSEAHVNGSVWQDTDGIWTAIVQTSWDGKHGLLRMNARGWPELHLDSEFNHNLPAFGHFPENSRLTVTCHAGKLYKVEAFLQMEDCVVRAKGEAQHGLRGELEYHNNCTALENWGSPDRIHALGSLVASSTLVKSQISVAIDDSELQGLVALKNSKNKNEASLFLNHSVPFLKKLGLPLIVSITLHSGSYGNGSFNYLLQSRAGNQKLHQELSVSKMSDAVRLQSSCRHTMDYLKDLGVPGNNSIQIELRSGQTKAVTLQSWFGGIPAGLSLKVKCLHLVKEVRTALWHSWSFLQERGVPALTEVLLSLRGYLPQLQSNTQITVNGQKLLSSSMNVSAAHGRLGVLLSYVSPTSNEMAQQRLDAALTAQFKGPLHSASVDVRSHDWRLLMMGDVGGWGVTRGSKEARVTLRHTVHGQSSPIFQVEAWGRLTESQLRCSMALNPELSSSLALIVQGSHLPQSKDMMLKVIQNIPSMLTFLPSSVSVRSQLNQSQSSVASLVEVLSGRRRLWAFGELAVVESCYRQTLELKHSYPQLKPLPRMIAVRTVYESKNWSNHVQQEALWGNQKVSLNVLHSAPPALHMGNHSLKVHISSVPRWTSLDLTLERFPQGRLDRLLLDWTRHGRLEQVRVVSLWSRSVEVNETKLELQQPFSSKLSHLSLFSASQSSLREQRSSRQTHFLWDGSVNVSLNLNEQWQNNSSRGQACAVFSSQQMSSVKGCLSAAQEGNSYSQNTELKWDNRSIKQGMKYQMDQNGLHSLQVNVWLDKVSPPPCPTHTLLAKIQTNLRDRLEHTLLLGVCPSQPSLSWSGSHRVNSGNELFYTQSRLSLTQHPFQCSVTVVLTNSSSAHKTNISLFSESRLGNWTIELGGSAQTSPQASGIELQAQLDRREKVWLNGTMKGRCLQTTAGYTSAPSLNEDIMVRACVGKDHRLILDIKGKDNINGVGSLGSFSFGTANQRLEVKACGCAESLTAVETQIHHWSSLIRSRLLEKAKTLQHLLTEFRRQSKGSDPAQELSLMTLNVLKRVEILLLSRQTDRGPFVLWQKSTARHFVTESLPQFLSLLQHASLLGQQELRRPLATLAGVYQDVKGQKLEALWRKAVSTWTQTLVEVVPIFMTNPQLQPMVQACVIGLSIVVDVAGQQSYHWLETRLALALSGVRKQLTSVYKFSPRECSVSVSVPLPQLHRPGTNDAELVQNVLEEWLLKPLQSMASFRPSAELYRLKRKIMDSPFAHQALLVANQFVVTYDGHLLELPSSCPLLLAQSISPDALFTLILIPNSQSYSLILQMDNNNISVHQNGQVRSNCLSLVTNTFFSDGVFVKRTSKVVEVSGQKGVTMSCDLSTELCSLTLDGWLHGTSVGLMGTNDNEEGNDFLLPRGSKAKNLTTFLSSWQVTQECTQTLSGNEHYLKEAISPVSCDYLFSSLDSPLSSCFRVVDPGQFLSVCERSSHRAPCRLASAFVYACQQNYIPLEVPAQCCKSC